MSFLSERTWARHANPWSGWTRVLTMPVLAAGLYRHSFLILGAAVVWMVINPMVFSKPKRVNNWMSKGVLGEQRYYREGKKFKRDLPTLLNVINVPVFVSFLYFGWQQEFVPMIQAGLLTMTIKFWFIDRMYRLADEV
ncbi:MAG: DUF6653 family protein [Patescibacteria group bacterium]|jgi:hypothetical protein